MLIGAVDNNISSQNPYANKVESGQNQPVNAVDKTDGISKAEQSKLPVEPRDEYIPSDGKSEKNLGIYRLETDENGSQKIVFDRSDSAEKSKQADATEGKEQNRELPKAASDPNEDGVKPEKGDVPKKSGDKGQDKSCTVNTDKVDAEIKKLKEQKQQIEQQLNSVRDDEEKRKDLEQRLSQVESELRAKDSDSYRKQHATYTYN